MTASPQTAVLPDESWNDTAREFRSDALVHQLVAEAAERHGDRPALVTADATVSHRELDAASNRLARHLKASGVPEQAYVAVLGDHRPATVTALLAVVKAGAAYVPLDPRWPAERLVTLLSSLNVRYLLVDRAHYPVAERIRWSVPGLRHVVCFDEPAERPWADRLDTDVLGEMWDVVAGSDDELVAAGFNRGDSAESYTEDDVRAYARHVAGLVTDALGPSGGVLEIGCGTGLILRELAPLVAHYTGVDPSPVAIGKAGARHPGAHLAVGFAHDVARHTRGRYDVAVLASTVQFFRGWTTWSTCWTRWRTCSARAGPSCSPTSSTPITRSTAACACPRRSSPGLPTAVTASPPSTSGGATAGSAASWPTATTCCSGWAVRVRSRR